MLDEVASVAAAPEAHYIAAERDATKRSLLQQRPQKRPPLRHLFGDTSDLPGPCWDFMEQQHACVDCVDLLVCGVPCVDCRSNHASNQARAALRLMSSMACCRWWMHGSPNASAWGTLLAYCGSRKWMAIVALETCAMVLAERRFLCQQ